MCCTKGPGYYLLLDYKIRALRDEVTVWLRTD